MSLAGKTPYEAYDNFRDSLQKAISCVNREAHLWALSSNGYSPGQDHAIAPNRGELVKLSGEQDISLTAFFAYRVESIDGEHGPWRVRTTAYLHALEDDSSHQEIIAYHWHPKQGSAFNFPHLHIERGIGADLGEIHKYHIPTGRVALEGILRLAINEFGVKERRADWREVIDETQAEFERGRSWS